ncbi:hypothetical protein SteCoe_17369 [Stentor coeruleus]|uniref:Uncharacterized protein n=1 Tax=Stentor coeruleus TaxID=5963 RepID=A0A1R2BZ27_9CILI|nr:hypothetical protein SteCoe_17369 [Stentor coeruleus]
MSSFIEESLIQKSVEAPQNQSKTTLIKLKVDENKNDEALDELRKAWNFIQLEYKLGLPNSFVTTLKGHTYLVTSVSFSPDGKFLASGSGDNLIKIWSLAENKEESTLSGHSGEVFCISYSPDGRYLASGSGDGQIKIWNLALCQEKHSLKGHSKSVLSVNFSPDGKSLVSGSGDNLIKLWNVEEGIEKFTLSGHESDVYCVNFSRDGQILASASGDCHIKIWNINKKCEEFSLIGSMSEVYSLSFSPNERFLASGSGDNLIKIWNLPERKEEYSLIGHKSRVASLSFSPDSKYLASGSGDNLIKIWNLLDKSEQCTLTGHSSDVFSVSFSPDGKFLSSGSGDKLIKIWNLAEKSEENTLSGHTNNIASIVFSKNGRYLASGSRDNLIKIWDTMDYKEETTLVGHINRVTSLSFTPDSKYLASGSGDNLVKIWDLTRKAEEFSLSGHIGVVWSVSFSPDGKLLASGSGDKTIKIWTFGKKTEDFTLTGHNGTVWSVSFSPDGRFLASGSGDNVIKIWNLKERKEDCTLTGHSGTVWNVNFSPDGRFLASGSGDNLIKIWNLLEKKVQQTLIGHKNKVYSVTFSPGGRFLASGSGDNLIKIWNLAENKEECTLNGHSSEVYCVNFSHNGKVLASGSGDKFIKIWNLAEKKEKDTPAGFDGSKLTVSFSYDGKLLACGYGDSVIKVWNVPDKKLECTVLTHQDSLEDLEAIEFTNENKTIIIIYKFGIKAFSIPSGEEVAISLKSDSKIQTQNKYMKILNPLSCASSGYQNQIKTAEAYFYFQAKEFEKIHNPNTILTNLDFSIAHFMAMLGQEDIMEKFIKSKNLIIAPDGFGHSPIFYSIKCKHQRITDMLVDYLSDFTSYQKLNYKTCLSLMTLESDLPELLLNSSPQIDKLLSAAFITQGSSVHFGSPLKELPIKIISESALSTFEEFSSIEGDTIPLIIKQAPFKLPFSIGTAASRDLISAILECKNKDIYRTKLIQYIITQKWEGVIFWVYFYTGLLWSNILGLYFLITTRRFDFLIALLIINTVLMIWEGIQMTVAGKKYFKSAINHLDLIRCYTTAVFGILYVLNIEYSELTWIMIVLNLLRGFTGFRAFGNTRYYIRLLQMCIVRMKDFLMIFVYATLSLGLMNAISAKEDALTYQSMWSSPFGLIVGKTEPFYEKNVIQVVTYVLAVTTNMIIMLNMIISILGDVFDEFQLDAEVFNYTEMAEVILENEQILSFWSSKEEFRYLHVCMHAYEKSGTEWKGKIIDVRDFLRDKFLNNHLKPLFNDSTEQIKAVNERMANNDNKIDEKIQNINDKIASVDEKVTAIEEKVTDRIKVADENASIRFRVLEDKLFEFQDKFDDIENKVMNIQGSIDKVLKIISNR